MERVVTITKGSIIDTCGGYLEVIDYNGHIVFCKCYLLSGEDDSYVQDDDRMLTLTEIADELKWVDGRNHTVKYNY